jgi:hypothetical protein
MVVHFVEELSRNLASLGQALGEHFIHAVGHLLELAPFALGRFFREEAGCLGFEGFANLIVFPNILGARKVDAGPHSWAALDKAVTLEALQGFGYGQQAHAQFLCELPA